jgi:DNA-binding beta-propeller fold protein YncE
MPDDMIDPVGRTDPEAAGGSADSGPPAMVSDASFAAALAAAPEDRRRRRKLLLLIVLGLAVVGLLMFSLWYLLFRQPISVLPLPGITQADLPHYAYSIYGVDAPVGVAVSPSGDRIYVTETGAQRLVHIFDGKGSQLGTFEPPDTTPETRIPVYVAIDPATEDVYVSDRTSASIFVYDRDGVFRRRFEPTPALASFAPLGLTFDPQGNLYVSDVGGPVHRIVEFDRDGKVVREIGSPGQFSFPNGLAIDLAGNLVVADSNNGRICVLDADGRQISAIGRGMAAGELGLPRGASVDGRDRLYVSDSTGQALRVYSLEQLAARPKYFGAVGSEGVGDGQFQYPNGVATDARARIYVVDWANDRVQVWSY